MADTGMRPIDQRVSDRISILRSLLIFGIVVLHVPPALTAADIVGDPFGFLKYGISRGLFRATVPVLTAISGYLLFIGFERFNYREIVKGKTKRILFPFLLWNLPLAILLYLIQREGMGGHEFRLSLYPFDPVRFADAAIALTDDPVNYPLDFLRDLYVIFLLSPIFLWLIRKAPWPGFAAITAIFLLDWDGLLVLRNTMPVCFYLGGMFAVHGWGSTRLDRLWPLAMALLLVASAAIAAFGIENVDWFRLISPPLVWIAAAPLVSTRAGAKMKDWSSDSFFVFLSHGPLLLFAYTLYQQLGEPFAYPLFWIGAPVLVCATALTTIRFMSNSSPALAGFLVGEFKSRRAKLPVVDPVGQQLLGDPAPATQGSGSQA